MQRVFRQQSLGLLGVEKNRGQNMTLHDRKGTRKISNTPLSALIKCCVINESLASSMKNSASVREFLFASDEAVLLNSPARKESISLQFTFPSWTPKRQNKYLGQTSSSISYKISHCNIKITLNYNIVVVCTKKKLVIWVTSNFILHEILIKAPEKRARDSKQQLYMTNPI